uniref:Uncharacterized protein LOC101498893 n=1 Tax=Cicer arietinum TaxID=3827 RepID=A0A1S2XLI5_CICAR|nr:uncharacterized protein LOC101498893 [Cicer arietinum]
MKGSSFVANVQNFSISPSFISSNYRTIFPSHVTLKPLLSKVKVSWLNHGTCVVQKQQKGKSGFVVECTNWSLVKELERELEDEFDSVEKSKSGMTRFREKCGENNGVVELLECLEKEAIMGDDVGKEPNDYNRRAQIFDRSSRVFQALKEFNDHV